MVKEFCKTIHEAFEMIKKHWKSDRGYNICMSERNTARAPKWAQELINSVNDLKQNFSQLSVEVKHLGERLEKVEQAVATILLLPTIKHEMDLKNKING